MATITRTSLINDTASESRNGAREYTLTYQVEMDGPSSSAEVKQNPGSLPTRGMMLGSDASARCITVNVTRTDDTLKVFEYEASFSTEITREDDQEENPLNDPPRVDWTSMESEEAYFVDVDGDNVVNSIGQQFEELPKRFAADWEVAVVTHESTFNITEAESLVGTTNSGSFTIGDGNTTWTIGAGVGLLVEYAPGELQERNGIKYYAVRRRWKLNADGWNSSEKYLDYGTYELDSGEWAPVTDSDGGEVTERFALDGSGSRVAPPGDAAELTFKPYTESDHSSQPVS